MHRYQWAVVRPVHSPWLIGVSRTACLNLTFNDDKAWSQTCTAISGSSVVRAFTHGAMGRRIDPSWGGPIELFLVPASAPRLV